MSKNKKLITLSEFSKIVGVTNQAVVYAIKKGKVPSAKKVKGVWQLNRVKAKKEWDANTDPIASAKGKKLRVSKKKEKAIDKAEVFEPKTFEGLTLADADRQDKVYKARMSQLKYLKESGELVSIADVKREAFEIARKVRDALMSIPARVSHELAVETDPHTLELQLQKELTDVLDKLMEVKNGDE